MKLRHIGKKVDSIKTALPVYERLGWRVIARERFKTVKLERNGEKFELVEGDYLEGAVVHASVDWAVDDTGFLFELVKEGECKS